MDCIYYYHSGQYYELEQIHVSSTIHPNVSIFLPMDFCRILKLWDYRLVCIDLQLPICIGCSFDAQSLIGHTIILSLFEFLLILLHDFPSFILTFQLLQSFAL